MDTSTAGSGRESFFQIWIRALTKPNESTYAALAASPRAKASTAFLWIFLCTFAPAFVSVLVSGSQISRQLAQAGVDIGEAGGGLGASLVNFLCITPFAAVVGVVGFVISVAIMQWIARMFKGQGTFDQLAYALGAITAPGSAGISRADAALVDSLRGNLLGDLERPVQHLPRRAGGHGDQGRSQIWVGSVDRHSRHPGTGHCPCRLLHRVRYSLGLWPGHGRCLQHYQPEPGAVRLGSAGPSCSWTGRKGTPANPAGVLFFGKVMTISDTQGVLAARLCDAIPGDGPDRIRLHRRARREAPCSPFRESDPPSLPCPAL